MRSYAELQVSSNFSFLRGASHPQELKLANVVDYAEGQHFILPFPQVLNDSARTHMQRCADLFGGNLHLALTRSDRGDDKQWIQTVAGFARSLSIPTAATNDVLYHDPGRKMLQDVVTCIREKCMLTEAGFRLDANAERHLKSPREVGRIFEAWPEALEAAIEIADR